jgi:hypothetical protein
MPAGKKSKLGHLGSSSPSVTTPSDGHAPNDSDEQPNNANTNTHHSVDAEGTVVSNS